MIVSDIYGVPGTEEYMYERYQMPFTLKEKKAEDDSRPIEGSGLEPQGSVSEDLLRTQKKDEPINRLAIFSDNTELFQTPVEPEPFLSVKVRVRVARDDVDEVIVVADGVNHSTYKREDIATDRFDFYEAELALEDKMVTYFFKINKGTQTVYFNRRGDVDDIDPFFNFSIFPGFHIPKWAKGAVMYQIFVDRFSNGDKDNDVVENEYTYIGEHVHHVDNWREYPASMDVRNFYGGDLAGVLKRLDYLQDLGVEVLYLNPIFVSPSNHKYDTQDYDHIDPHYTVIEHDGGEPLEPDDHNNAHASKYIQRVADPKNLEASDAYFARFVEEVHKRGMKVILDGVFNHCGSFNKWLDREKIYYKAGGYEPGAYETEKSAYHTFFKFYDGGEWPNNNYYDAWWGNDTLPKLNYEESPKLYQYILRVAAKWVAPPYNVDGWRLDVAADLGHSPEFNHKFWRDFRTAVKTVNPEALILAEHYGDPSGWLDGSQWDTVMNYDAFMEPITWFLTGMDKHSDVSKPELRGNQDAFFAAMTNNCARMPLHSLQAAMNELSNHDHSRFMTRTNFTVGRTAFSGPMAAEQGIRPEIFRQAVVFQLSWGGAPTIYYGDEAGLCGWTDPDNRRTYPWHHEDTELIRFCKEAIRVHRDYEMFKTGSLIYLASEPGLIGFGRTDGKESAIILIQVEGSDRDVEIDAWRIGMKDGMNVVRMLYTDSSGYTIQTESKKVENGKISIHIGHNSAVIWKSIDF